MNFTNEELNILTQALELLAYHNSQRGGQRGEDDRTQAVVKLEARVRGYIDRKQITKEILRR